MNLCVLGVWHQATVLSASLADLGHDVTVCGPRDAIDRLREGELPVYEPGLDEMTKRVVAAGKLNYDDDAKACIPKADVVYIAIDTPVDHDDRPDVTSVFDAAKDIGEARFEGIVVITAQVPVGTCRVIERQMRQDGAGARFAYVPEFLELGRALERFTSADRIVIGADSPETSATVASIYEPLQRPMYTTDVATAEMAKHASNGFLATSISFINEVADLCDATGADVTAVARIMRLDRRIGPNAFLDAGLGFAGGTLGRELRVLQDIAAEHSLRSDLIDAVVTVNARRREALVERIRHCVRDLADSRIALYGLAYKPGTSATRRSIALEVIADLTSAGAEVTAYDPLARVDENEDVPTFDRATDPYEATDGADVLVIVTPWDGLKAIDWARVAGSMRSPVLVDSRNELEPEEISTHGFLYMGMGRGGGGT